MRLALFTATGLSVLVGLGLLMATGARTLDRDEAPLYERLGGEVGVDIVVDNFLAKVTDDDWLGVRFADTDMSGLREFLVAQLCEATGGPCLVDWSGMPEAHMVTGVTEYEFSLMIQYFAEAMMDAGVDTHEHVAAMHLLADMYDDVIRR